MLERPAPCWPLEASCIFTGNAAETGEVTEVPTLAVHEWYERYVQGNVDRTEIDLRCDAI